MTEDRSLEETRPLGRNGRRKRVALGLGVLLVLLLLAAAAQYGLGGAPAGALGLAVALASVAVAAFLAFGSLGDDAAPNAGAAPKRRPAADNGPLTLPGFAESLSDGVLAIDASGAIRSANAAALQMLGYAEAELVGRPARDVLPGGLEGAGGEIEARRKNGAPFPADLAVSSAHGLANPARVARLRDLSERSAAEDGGRARRLETVGQLAGGVAHDFNNLLTVVLAYSGLLCDALAERDAKLGRMAEAVRTAAREAADLNRQLLAFGRPRTAGPAEIDMGQLLKAMQRLLRPALGDSVEFVLRLTAEPARVFVDRAQLETAIMDLAVNGRAALPEGGRLTIETELTPREDRVRHVAIAIRVEAPGPAAPDFQAFLAAAGAEGEAGASMLRRLAAAAGGEVRTEQGPANRATVALLLPALAVPQDRAPPRLGDAAGGETILVVEDEPLVRDLVVAQLRRLGYRVVEAADGPAALVEIERGSRFDLVFTDLVMPGGMSGFALAEAARRVRPGLRFLFTSGYSEDQAGASPPLVPERRILRKPYELRELAARIRWALTEAPS